MGGKRRLFRWRYLGLDGLQENLFCVEKVVESCAILTTLQSRMNYIYNSGPIRSIRTERSGRGLDLRWEEASSAINGEIIGVEIGTL